MAAMDHVWNTSVVGRKVKDEVDIGQYRISASKSNRRRQEEWTVCNYEERAQASLFEGEYFGE